MIIKIGPGLVVPDPIHIAMDIGVAAVMTPIEATPGHFTDSHDMMFLMPQKHKLIPLPP